MPYVYPRSIEPLIAIVLNRVCGSSPAIAALLGRFLPRLGPLAATQAALLSSADGQGQSQVQDGMMLFFIYWLVVLDPATWSPNSVPLQRDQD
jgi:hypothetical protein